MACGLPATTLVGMTKLIWNLLAMYLLMFSPILLPVAGSILGSLRDRLARVEG